MKKLTVFMLIIVIIRFCLSVYTGMQHDNGLGKYGYVLVPVFSPIYFCFIMVYIMDLKRDAFLEYQIGIIHAFAILFLYVDLHFYLNAIH